MGEFGDKFRKAREKKELSYDDVSNVTKISSRMLQAIEEEHFDQLPGGVFNKGFIRAYAKHLGLDPEESVTDYLACLRQAQIDAHEVWDPQPPAHSRAAAPPTTRAEKPHVVEANKPVVKAEPPAEPEELPDLQLPRAEHVRPGRKDLALKSSPEIPWSIVAVASVVVVLAIILWTRHTRATNAGTTSANTVQAKATESKPAEDQIANEKSTPESGLAAPTVTTASTSASTKSQTISAAGPLVSAPQSSPANSQPAVIQPIAAPMAKSPAAANSGGDSVADKTDVTVRTFPKSTSKPSDKSPAPLTLTIRATETSWISVLADGQPASQETLIAPAHTSVRATHEIVAKIGNAAGVTFLWNGQEIPAAGAEAEVKTFVFDSEGMRVLPTPSQPPTQNQ